MIPENPALAALLQQFPKGFTVSPEGEVAPSRGPAEKVTSITRLAEMAREPKRLQFDLHGAQVELTLRPLSSREGIEADRIDGDLMPPPKMKTVNGRQEADGFDFEDPKYRAKRSELYQVKRAFIISRGVTGLEIPGDTLEGKADWLAEQLPPHVLDLILEKIKEITSDPIVEAAFI